MCIQYTCCWNTPNSLKCDWKCLERLKAESAFDKNLSFILSPYPTLERLTEKDIYDAAWTSSSHVFQFRIERDLLTKLMYLVIKLELPIHGRVESQQWRDLGQDPPESGRWGWRTWRLGLGWSSDWGVCEVVEMGRRYEWNAWMKGRMTDLNHVALLQAGWLAKRRWARRWLDYSDDDSLDFDSVGNR